RTPAVHPGAAPVHRVSRYCGARNPSDEGAPMMREAYRSELRHIVDDLVDMADLVGRALEDATRALLEGDLGLAERVIAADPHVDERQVELDAKAVELLARQAPVATDLRLLVAAM